MRRLVWNKVAAEGTGFSYQAQTADGNWAELSYISNSEIGGIAWSVAEDRPIREIYKPIAPQRPKSLAEATAYMAAAAKDLAELAAEAMLDAQIQMEATLRRFEITGILDYNEAYRALRALPAHEADAKVTAWWARNPGPDDRSIVAPPGSL